jgi:hypothetical protein
MYVQMVCRENYKDQLIEETTNNRLPKLLWKLRSVGSHRRSNEAGTILKINRLTES